MSIPASTVFPFRPVVIIGAPRSGTNALRDMLSSLPQFGTWPCDEINPIWRYGNGRCPSDEIPASRATARVRHFIRRAFLSEWRRVGKPEYLIEKTCANSLRLPFVRAILPEARFVVIVRNGYSVIPSALKRWSGEFELEKFSYVFAKSRYIPVSEVPAVVYSQLRRHVYRLRGAPQRSEWGPRWNGSDAIGHMSLSDICALQWLRCVGLTMSTLPMLRPSCMVQLRYEDLCKAPQRALSAVLAMLDTTAPANLQERAAQTIRARNAHLDDCAMLGLSADIAAAVSASNDALGYPTEDHHNESHFINVA